MRMQTSNRGVMTVNWGFGSVGVTTTRWATFKLTGVHLALAWENQGNGAASPPLPLVSGNHWHARRGPANLNMWRHLRSASLTKSQTRQTTFQVFRGHVPGVQGSCSRCSGVVGWFISLKISVV